MQINPVLLMGEAIPSLNLNFLTGSLDSRITFTRASSGTYFDSTGTLKTASTDVARFDYNPATLAPGGLLIEQASTNLALYSEQFDNVAWALTATTVTANATTAPDGNVTADKLKEDNTTSIHSVTNTVSFSVTSGTTYTGSIFLKAAERGYAFVVISGATTFTTAGISVNLTTGAVSTATGTPVNAFTQTLPNGWFRVGFSLAATGTATDAKFDVRCSTDGVWANRSYTGTTGSGIYVWGAQFEATAYQTSYIATTSASVTRAADVSLINTLTPWYNAAQGTFVITATGVNNVNGGTRRFLEIGVSGSTNNRMIIGYASTNQTRFLVVTGGATQADITVSGTAGSRIKMAAAYNANDFQQATNGVLGTQDTSGTVPTISSIAIGSDFGSTANAILNGWIESIKYYPVRLPDATLQALTS